jgi:hypothetical protein
LQCVAERQDRKVPFFQALETLFQLLPLDEQPGTPQVFIFKRYPVIAENQQPPLAPTAIRHESKNAAASKQA